MTAAAALPGLHPEMTQAAATVARGLPLLDLVTALQPSCFDAACQRQKDALLVASLLAPLLIFGAAAAYLLRPPPQASLDDGSLFQDSSTGAVFEAQQGTVPERDRRGELAFRAVSYTPWPVEEGAEGERLRIPQGTVGQLQPRTFVFSRVLPQPSQLVMVTLERPLGIIFEEDVRRKRAVVVGFTPGGHAEQQAKRARLNTAFVAALEGDVLRACTATNIVWQPGSLVFGAQRPTRSIVCYGADQQRWPNVISALRKGLVADGPVTVVLERALPAETPGSQRGFKDTTAGAVGHGDGDG